MKNNIRINQFITSGRPVKVAFVFLTVILLSVVSFSVVLAQSEDTISSDDVTTEQRTNQTTSSTALLENDALKPYLVKIIDGERTMTVSTVSNNPKSILESSGLQIYSEDNYSLVKHSDPSDPLIGYRLEIDRATLVNLNVRGDASLIRTQKNTVADLIKEKGITLTENDILVPTAQTILVDGMKVSVYSVGVNTVTVEEDIIYETRVIDDPSMDYGTNVVQKTGINGKAKVTYEITYYDGREVSRAKLDSITLQPVVNQITIRGTKGGPYVKGPLNAAQIQFLGGCESGMTATRNNGNGYYGAFQFSAGTWNAMGTGYARADLAPLDVQIQAVQQLLSRSSIYGQFPGCANAMVAAGLL